MSPKINIFFLILFILSAFGFSGCYTSGLQYAISTAQAIPILGESLNNSIPRKDALGSAKVKIVKGMVITIKAESTKKNETDTDRSHTNPHSEHAIPPNP